MNTFVIYKQNVAETRPYTLRTHNMTKNIRIRFTEEYCVHNIYEYDILIICRAVQIVRSVYVYYISKYDELQKNALIVVITRAERPKIVFRSRSFFQAHLKSSKFWVVEGIIMAKSTMFYKTVLFSRKNVAMRLKNIR